METSDSEYFESADEDINSDNETSMPEKHAVEKKNINLDHHISKLKNIELTEKSNYKQDDVVKTDSKSNVDNVTSSKLQPETNDEPNLWDIDEIDWEVEGSNSQGNDTLNKASPHQINDTKTEDENLWGDDEMNWGTDTEETYKSGPKSDESKPNKNSGWDSWSNWGVSSILNTASQSVSSLTAHVSQGISTVLEGGIGIPDPEEIARINSAREKQTETSEEEDIEKSSPTTPLAFGLGNLVGGVSHITKFVESTGTKVISGSLDTLETIGKKTMEVLQEGDPGLKKKRAFLKLDTGKPVLSQVLREAKEKAEIDNNAENIIHTSKTKNYETVFDDHQGLVHLEALEMLSKLCSMKLQTLTNSLEEDKLKDMQETMEQVKDLCELPEEDEIEEIALSEVKEKMDNSIKDVSVAVSCDRLVSLFEESNSWIDSYKALNPNELHQQAIDNLAQITALAVEWFHKAGELLLVKEHRSTADEADGLLQLTVTTKFMITKTAGSFCDKLNTCPKSEDVNALITNIYYEASNSCSYLDNAFQLLLPVLQVGAI